MDDQQRLAAFLDKTKAVDGLNHEQFQRLMAELTLVGNRAGHDDQ